MVYNQRRHANKLTRRPKMKTRRHRLAFDISLLGNGVAAHPKREEQPVRDADGDQQDPTGGTSGVWATTSGPRLGMNRLTRGLRRHRIAVECPGLFKLPDTKHYESYYDKRRPWKATVGTVVVIDDVPTTPVTSYLASRTFTDTNTNTASVSHIREIPNGTERYDASIQTSITASNSQWFPPPLVRAPNTSTVQPSSSSSDGTSYYTAASRHKHGSW